MRVISSYRIILLFLIIEDKFQQNYQEKYTIIKKELINIIYKHIKIKN